MSKSSPMTSHSKPVEACDSLLLFRLDGHGLNLFVAPRLEQSLGVVLVGLVAGEITVRHVRRNEEDLVAEARNRPCPEVCHAAGFEEHRSWSRLCDPGGQLAAREAVALSYLSGDLRHQDLKNILRQVDCDHGRIHLGSSCIWNSLQGAILAL